MTYNAEMKLGTCAEGSLTIAPLSKTKDSVKSFPNFEAHETRFGRCLNTRV
jgi:hypothetical protein